MGSENEIWKDVVGYEGLYEVSNLGGVRSAGRLARGRSDSMRLLKPRVLKPNIGTTGYYFVNLCKHGRQRSTRVHRLVAEAFIANPGGLPFVNHKDGVKTNNRMDNLEWCTCQYNTLHAHRIGLVKNNRPVMDADTGEVFYSESECARVIGGTQSNVRRCAEQNLHGGNHKYKGRKMVFADTNNK